MRIFNEVGRWYSIPCKILTQVIYVKKNFLNPLKRIRVIIRTPTHGLTDGRTDRRTDEHGESSIPPLNFIAGGIINFIKLTWQPFCSGLNVLNIFFLISASIWVVDSPFSTWQSWVPYYLLFMSLKLPTDASVVPTGPEAQGRRLSLHGWGITPTSKRQRGKFSRILPIWWPTPQSTAATCGSSLSEVIIMTWKHFLHYWSLCGESTSPMDSPH